MNDTVEKIIAALVVGLLLCIATTKGLGIMQQSGYKNGGFWQWLKRKDNLYFNRLWVLALCLGLTSAVISLCFSFLGVKWAQLLSALPFLGLIIGFTVSDRKYALKVKSVHTGRWWRLFGIYYFFTATLSYILIAFLGFLAKWNGSELYGLIAYVPVALTPLFLPLLLALANATTSVFENARNKKFVKKAETALKETQITRVAVVGSYGKTSVKNIFKTLLEEKYAVATTPASYNTPIGIAKTVLEDGFKEKQVFIAEMGARKRGDITELCELVKPDYALFTGVCEQHIESFETLENILAEKSEVLRSGAKKVVCGSTLFGKVEGENALFVNAVENLSLGIDGTAFTLTVGEEKIEVKTALLGRANAENISLAVALAFEMGLTVEEIKKGLAKLQPVEHRLQRLENNGVVILDDGYNCNIVGAKNALEVLATAKGRTCVITPGIVEGGILEDRLNEKLGEMLINADRVILVGETLVLPVKTGYVNAGGDSSKLTISKTLTLAQEVLAGWIKAGDTVLFLNDLPDAY